LDPGRLKSTCYLAGDHFEHGRGEVTVLLTALPYRFSVEHDQGAVDEDPCVPVPTVGREKPAETDQLSRAQGLNHHRRLARADQLEPNFAL